MHARPKPKPKYIVIVCEENSIYWGFFINSDIRPFVKRNQKLLDCQILILRPDYPTVLRHDSYIDCTHLYSFAEAELKQPVILKTKTKEDIKRVVSESALIEEKYKTLILSG